MKHLIQSYALLLFVSLTFGCATSEEAPSDGTGGSTQDMKLDPKPEDEACAASDLSLGSSVRVTYDSGPAPAPKGGTLPTSGTYDLIDWTVYGTEQGDEVDQAATYRFGKNNTLDASFAGIQGSMTWKADGANLFMTVLCPNALKDSVQVFQYTAGDDTVTLFSDDGVQVLKKR